MHTCATQQPSLLFTIATKYVSMVVCYSQVLSTVTVTSIANMECWPFLKGSSYPDHHRSYYFYGLTFNTFFNTKVCTLPMEDQFLDPIFPYMDANPKLQCYISCLNQDYSPACHAILYIAVLHA